MADPKEPFGEYEIQWLEEGRIRVVMSEWRFDSAWPFSVYASFVVEFCELCEELGASSMAHPPKVIGYGQLGHIDELQPAEPFVIVARRYLESRKER